MRILVPRTDYVYVDTYHQGVISMRIHDMYNDMIGFLLTRMALCSQRETENPCLHVPRCCSQWSGDECGPRTHANSWVLSKVGFRQFQGLFLEWKSGSFCIEGARMAVVRFFWSLIIRLAWNCLFLISEIMLKRYTADPLNHTSRISILIMSAGWPHHPLHPLS